ncbi:MAG: hypothetical protein AW09_000454 [Candidatus Accumulibacter phosphatis]|uniref:Uncharacterized protein n=1 Tax=Candidatus Accumulibacter phosphatis TaxID=327160 RepID=A0A080LZL5_9PROT|nr:MAG: hypothetical protein AW09_000454 [Candidatus Accumulibacter phosphatis]
MRCTVGHSFAGNLRLGRSTHQTNILTATTLYCQLLRDSGQAGLRQAPPRCLSTTTKTSLLHRCCYRDACVGRSRRSIVSRAPPTTSPTKAMPATRYACRGSPSIGRNSTASRAVNLRPGRTSRSWRRSSGSGICPYSCCATCLTLLRRMSSRSAMRITRNSSTTADVPPIRWAGCCCTWSGGTAKQTCTARTASAPPCSWSISGRTSPLTGTSSASICHLATLNTSASPKQTSLVGAGARHGQRYSIFRSNERAA